MKKAKEFFSYIRIGGRACDGGLLRARVEVCACVSYVVPIEWLSEMYESEEPQQ